MDSYGMTFKGPMILAAEAEGPYVDIRSYDTFATAATALNLAGTNVTLYITENSTMTMNTSANVHLRVAPNVYLQVDSPGVEALGGITCELDGYVTVTTGNDLLIGKSFNSPSMNNCLRGLGSYSFEWGAVPYIDATWIGALPNSINSSSTAINKCYDIIKSVNGTLATSRRDLPAYFPPGVYYCDVSTFPGATITDTDSKCVRTIFGHGATFYGTCSGTPVFDFTGGVLGKFYGFNIYGDGTDVPNIGILMARKDKDVGSGVAVAANGSTFTDVSVLGSFTVTGLYNYASEDNLYINFSAEVEGTTAKSAVIFDGENYHAVTSPNVTIAGTSATTDSQLSSSNFFLKGNFTNSIAAPSPSTQALIHIHNSDGIGFEGCQFSTVATDHPIIWLSGEMSDDSKTCLSVNKSRCLGGVESFLYVGKHNAGHPATQINGISIKDSKIDVANTGYLLKTDGTTAVEIHDLDISNVSGTNLNILAQLSGSIISAAEIKLEGIMSFRGYFQGKISTTSAYAPNFTTLTKITATIFYNDVGQCRTIAGIGGSPVFLSQRNTTDGFLRYDASAAISASDIDKHLTSINGGGQNQGPRAPSGVEAGWSFSHMVKINVSYPSLQNIAITAITWTAGTVTVTVASNPFEVNTSVQIEDVVPNEYNGIFKVLTSAPTQFTYALPDTPSTTPGTGGKSSGYKFYYTPMFEAVPAA